MTAIPPYDYGDDPRRTAMRRVQRAFRWTTAAAVAAVGVVVGVVAHELPGRTTSPSSASSAGSSGSTSSGSSSSGSAASSSGSAGSLSPSVPAPVPTTSPPTVISGGSGIR